MSRTSFHLLLTFLAFNAGGSLVAQTKAVPVAIPRPVAKAPASTSPAWQNPPKLVVGIVVDQMRPDYIYRYWSNFGEGGFKRLIGDGSFLRDAHYTYMPTVTGPGHASIYTGSVPAHHGIVANERYDRATGKMIYCVKDTTVQGVGSATAQSSPSQLLATTLADEIERRTDRQGRTIGVALKDRSSVLPIGRTGDAAYWFSGSGSFVTSTWYMKQLPKWVEEFNARKLTEKYLNATWTPLLPIEKYHQVLPDDNPYEQPLAAGSGSAFPYDLAALSKGPSGLTLIASTPWGNTLTTDMALAAIAGEGMGQDNSTDLLAISYSSTDILGHKMGPRALEVEDMYIRLDLELARLLAELDKSVGAGKYTLFLTADHGAIDVPQYLKDLRGSAGYADVRSIRQEINRALAANDPQDSVAYIGDGQVFLAERKDPGVHLSYMARPVTVRDVLIAQPCILAAWPASNLAFGLANGTTPMGLVANGYMNQRCGDILYTLKPGYFEAEGAYIGKGTTHGTGWNYDTHVPVIFFGQGIAHGEVVRRTAVADIVPTICMIVGCALPDAAVGEPVPEALPR
jgi:predicted AlkP superfamily pyrophosphatase or phosphodiesterase